MKKSLDQPSVNRNLEDKTEKPQTDDNKVIADHYYVVVDKKYVWNFMVDILDLRPKQS